MAAQAGLSVTWSKIPKTGFLVTRLIYSVMRESEILVSYLALNYDNSTEPTHEIMALFVLRKLILQTRMRSHPVELDVWFFMGPFVYFHISCVRTAKALARLRGCAGSPEPSLVAYVISTIISWALSIIDYSFVPQRTHVGIWLYDWRMVSVSWQTIQSRSEPKFAIYHLVLRNVRSELISTTE